MHRLFALILVALALTGCAASNLDKRILCLDGQAYFMTKMGPVAMPDRAADADPLCKGK